MLRQRTPHPPNFAEGTFTNSHKAARFTKVFSLKSFLLYGMCGVIVLLLFPRAAEAARSVPNVKIMVDHCGLPYERDDATMRVWREGGCRREGRKREEKGEKGERKGGRLWVEGKEEGKDIQFYQGFHRISCD